MSMAKMRKRGWIWILVGIGLQVGGLLADRPFVVRGTGIPFAPVIIGLGVILLLWDYIKARKEAERGDSPTPPP
jgi:hypothetical protein